MHRIPARKRQNKTGSLHCTTNSAGYSARRRSAERGHAEPDKVDEDPRAEDAADVVYDEALIDAPASKTDIRFEAPDRKKAAKRGAARHEEKHIPKG